MQMFHEQDGCLNLLRRQELKLERDLQALCEANLDAMFGLELVKHEFTVKEFRIDTLAFDAEASAFVIIEYKRGSNFSVIDQGFAYLSILHGNPAEFVLIYNQTREKNLKKEDVDWARSRVYFVAPSYTPYQRQAVSFRDLPMDLWEVNMFDGGVITLQHVGDSVRAPSLREAGVGPIEPLGQRSAQYTVEDHLEGRPPEIKQLYKDLSTRLTSHDDVTERPISVAVLFESEVGRFAEIIVQKKQLVVHFDYYDGDPRGLVVRDLDGEGKGHYWAVGPYQIKVHPGDDLGPVVNLLSASYSGVTGLSIGKP